MSESSETDLTRIALYLLAGLTAIRKEYKGRVMTYYFNRADVEQVVKKISDPDMEPFRRYIHTLKGVQAETSAMRQAANRTNQTY